MTRAYAPNEWQSLDGLSTVARCHDGTYDAWARPEEYVGNFPTLSAAQDGADAAVERLTAVSSGLYVGGLTGGAIAAEMDADEVFDRR